MSEILVGTRQYSSLPVVFLLEVRDKKEPERTRFMGRRWNTSHALEKPTLITARSCILPHASLSFPCSPLAAASSALTGSTRRKEGKAERRKWSRSTHEYRAIFKFRQISVVHLIN